MVRTIFRFLGLVPLMAVAWACSDVGPADPGQAMSIGPSAVVSGDASAMDRASCAHVTAVAVKIVPAVGPHVVTLRATYVYATPGAEACTTAPAWQASRAGLNIDPSNPFKASLARQSDVKTTVTAAAPNGIEGSLVF